VRGQQTSAPKPLSVGEKALVAVAVTWAAGFVDTTGYLRLSHIFTANMSGNTVRVSLGAATWNWNMAAQRFWPLVAFVTGLLISAAIHEAGHRREFTRTSAIVFGMEAMLLACFMALSRTVWAGNLQSGEPFYVCTALLGLAMGLQNATITRVGALSVKTTHITGTLTSFAEAFGEFLFWLRDRLHAPYRNRWQRVYRTAWRQKTFREAVLTASLWIAFFLGGVAAVLGLHSWGNASLVPIVVFLLLLALLDLRRPIAASDEHAGHKPRAASRVKADSVR
jgi:uncharacterized membrane protein YoaK (UPF0700 family)